MRIRNAFRILISNASVIYKAALFRLITASVAVLIIYFTLYNDLLHLFQSDQAHALWDAIIHIFTDFVKGYGIDIDELPTAFEGFIAMLRSNVSIFTVVGIKTSACIFFYNVILRMGNYAVSSLYSGYMSAGTKFSLIPTLFANLGKAFLYAIIIVPIVMLFDTLVILLGALIGVYGIRLISIFAIILSLIFIIFAISFKFTVFSFFLPNMVVENQSVGQAFVNTFKNRSNLKGLLTSYSFLVMLIFYVNVSVAVFTLGAGLVVSLPITTIMTLLVSLCDYYNHTGKKYYVDFDTVVIPKQLQENAEYLKYM
ncbi:MAG: hypothetical protein IJW13_01810 [Clostridia bacterium]|nr:hypothetical protein [Clostridia bacterium]